MNVGGLSKLASRKDDVAKGSANCKICSLPCDLIVLVPIFSIYHVLS